jgi:hypothetical protein
MGARYTHLFNSGEWQRQLSITAASSLRAFWFTDTTLTLTHPALGSWNTARDRLGLHLYAKTRNLPQLPYYGIGPSTNTGNRADYRMNNQSVGADVSNPLSSWLAVGGRFETVWTQLNGTFDPDVTPIQAKYNETSAPGLLRQPTMLHTEVYLRPHHPSITPYFLDYKIGYNFYHDTGGGQFSFQRFVADVRHNVYPERSFGQIRRDSILSLRAYLSTAHTSSGSVVPFYYQETLGGSDINGEPTLRGYRDYRFRGPDILLFQAEYNRRLWGPLGGLVFYDAGTVETKFSNLDINRLRQSFGFGISLFLADKIWFKAYVGLGGGEGRHTYFVIPPGLL